MREYVEEVNMLRYRKNARGSVNGRMRENEWENERMSGRI